MTNYQKAIKVRKDCETRSTCKNCPYRKHCLKSNIVFPDPILDNLKNITIAIVKEKWNVK